MVSKILRSAVFLKQANQRILLTSATVRRSWADFCFAVSVPRDMAAYCAAWIDF